jgi:predicted AlkP superfamily phosphohydrolase/phosphomutase
MTGARPRLLFVGLDSASPSYLFDRCLEVMPNFRRLFERSSRAALRTTDPPISLPAWAVMCTGVDPGTLGLYGFRHRLHHSYTQTYGPSSDRLPVPTLWQILSDRGYRLAVIGMPPGYPPPTVNGIYISDFLTPGGATNWTHPPELATDLESKYGPFPFDVTFRATERDQLFRDIVAMTQHRFAVAEELYGRERWDVFAIHEVGTDRLHHAYTKYFDPGHADYRPGNPYEHVLLDYYRVLDRSLGRLLAHVDDQTLVVVGSDHGSMPMQGCFCINQWLESQGYLTLAQPVARGTPFERAGIDWSRSSVWGAGGYYARVFFNIRGREPEGTVAPEEVPELRRRLTAQLSALRTPQGAPLVTRIFSADEVYRHVVGDPPDLMIYFDDLRWRSAGTLGHEELFLRENDTGPDDAVHHPLGLLLIRRPGQEEPVELPPQDILDVTPTVLALLGEPIPGHVQGRPISGLSTRDGEMRSGGTGNG